MSKFKVGDKVKFNDATMGKGVITEIGLGLHPYIVKYGNDHTSYCSEDFLILVDKSKKIAVGKAYKVFKKSCNNYETTITAKTDKEALKQFKKAYKHKAGFELHMVLLSSVEDKKVVFK